MTSDAKIGLLLGLVFIFVVAFLINGLPSLRPPISNAGAITTLPAGEDVPLDTGSTGQAVANWTQQLDQQRLNGEPAPPPVETPRPATSESASLPPQPTASQTANAEGVRFSLPLPGKDQLQELLTQLTPALAKEQVSLDIPRPAPEPVPAPQPAAPPARVADTPPQPRPAPAANPQPDSAGGKFYVVVSGDTLPAIAKKMYGLEEGNRFANIERIYQANQTILKSPDMVIVGQKLVIPPPLPPLPKEPVATGAPAKAATRAPRPADVLPKTLFEEPKTLSEKVGSLGRRAAAVLPPPTPAGRWYTVQEGDNLWKIAASQLGGGTRWDEIHKLNADILPSQDSLKLGMRLRLPAK